MLTGYLDKTKSLQGGLDGVDVAFLLTFHGALAVADCPRRTTLP